MIRQLWKNVHRFLVYPSIVGLRGEHDVFRFLREIAAQQWETPEQLLARQEWKLAETLRHAARSVPYYRQRWVHDPASISPQHAADVLAALPLLTKADLQVHTAALVSDRRPRRVIRKTTGGSTGQAVTVWKDCRGRAREMAVTWLAYSWFGIGIGDRAVRFWGQPFSLRRKLRFAAADFATHRKRFSAFGVNDASLHGYWRACERFRPDYFYGYVSMIETFADYVTAAGLDGTTLGLKAVITTSEVLSQPQRRRLAATFGCPVQNEYGCGEVGPIAYECPKGALHLMTDHLWIELLDESGRPVPVGGTGEVVVTDLYNRAMPLVRYRVGDFAVKGAPCSCGRGYPTIDRIWGRAYDFIQGADGRKYHGEFFMYVFEEMRDQGMGAQQFQVVQDSPTNLAFAIVGNSPPTQAQIAHLERRVRERLGPMQVSIRAVDRIERSTSGKLPLIVNRIPRSADAMLTR